MDIKHVLGTNPLRPAYRLTRPPAGEDPGPVGWTGYEGGLVEVGVDAQAGSPSTTSHPAIGSGFTL